jgi:hypothetical protein
MSDQTLSGFFGLDDAQKAQEGAAAMRQAQEIARSRGIPPAFRKAAADAAITILKDIIDTPLSNVLGDAWSTHRELKSAINAPAGQVSDFTLHEHEIALSRKPSAEIVINGAPTGVTLEFEVKLALNIASATLKIRDGAIVGCELGKTKGAGSVKCGKVTIAKRETSSVRLPATLTFSPGVMLRG